jgi:hypothetical protein
MGIYIEKLRVYTTRNTELIREGKRNAYGHLWKEPAGGL